MPVCRLRGSASRERVSLWHDSTRSVWFFLNLGKSCRQRRPKLRLTYLLTPVREPARAGLTYLLTPWADMMTVAPHMIARRKPLGTIGLKALRSCAARAAAVQVRAMHLTCAWHCALMCGVRSCACEVAVHVPPARRLAWLMPWPVSRWRWRGCAMCAWSCSYPLIAKRARLCRGSSMQWVSWRLTCWQLANVCLCKVARPLVVVARRGEILYDWSASYALIAKRARRRRHLTHCNWVRCRLACGRGLLAGSVVCEAQAQACARACVSEP